MSAIIQLVGLASGQPTPIDGQYLVEYDPTRPGHLPDGRELLAHVVTTPDPTKARRFADAAEAHGVWTAPSGLAYPRNAPLTAYTIVLLPVDEDADRDERACGGSDQPPDTYHDCGTTCPSPCPLDDDDPRGWQG